MTASEKSQLLDDEEEAPKSVKIPVTGFIIGIIVFVHMASFTILLFDLSQYTYSVYKDKEFPNATLNQSDKSLCETNTSSKEFQMEQTIQSDTARWTVYISISGGIPAIFSAPLISSLSDRFGRKKTLLVPLFGSLVKSGLCFLNIFMNYNVNFFIIYLFIEGCTGGWVSSVAICSSGFADITKAGKQRSFAFAILGLGVGVGFLAGTLLSGYLIEAFGFNSPVIASGAMVLIGILLTLFVLKEPLKDENRVSSVHPLRQIKESLDLYIHGNKDPNYGRRWQYIILISAFNLLSMAALGKTNVEILYQIGSPFCWNPIKISNFGTIRSVIQEFVGVVSIRLMQCFMSDDFIAVIGTLSAIGYFVMEALSKTSFDLYMVPVVGCLGIIEITMIRSIMSRLTPPDKQGSMFGGIALFENVCFMVGSVAGGAIYSETVSFLPGFAFWVMAGFNLIALFLLIIFYIGAKRINIHYKEINIT
ncbi:lysosomal proton-coupled steroid conjugate and bile acid symporter SLC46A3-like [Crassostrea virginica]|uniref:Solute carrier family 46 member 3-like n=1 Tax=Crassostrea virginica TaxID=6565 RepID=A0A8B8DR13_CRAVI|nr:solute carrier family 46 member 3-like [Crassostrea virginica]XP_022330265.1 solute carrier family 46 member 3-like [Crassostrea virginica]